MQGLMWPHSLFCFLVPVFGPSFYDTLISGCDGEGKDSENQ